MDKPLVSPHRSIGIGHFMAVGARTLTKGRGEPTTKNIKNQPPTQLHTYLSDLHTHGKKLQIAMKRENGWKLSKPLQKTGRPHIRHGHHTPYPHQGPCNLTFGNNPRKREQKRVARWFRGDCKNPLRLNSNMFPG